jgi:hypothetical protein
VAEVAQHRCRVQCRRFVTVIASWTARQLQKSRSLPWVLRLVYPVQAARECGSTTTRTTWVLPPLTSLVDECLDRGTRCGIVFRTFFTTRSNVMRRPLNHRPRNVLVILSCSGLNVFGWHPRNYHHCQYRWIGIFKCLADANRQRTAACELSQLGRVASWKRGHSQ